MPRPMHFDLCANDPQRALAFYKAAFGWTAERWTGGSFEYYLIRTGGAPERGIDGGLMRATGGKLETTLTLAVASLEAAMTAVTAAGGTIEGQVEEIPGVGRMVNCRDTEGNVIGLMEEFTPEQPADPGEAPEIFE